MMWLQSDTYLLIPLRFLAISSARAGLSPPTLSDTAFTSVLHVGGPCLLTSYIFFNHLIITCRKHCLGFSQVATIVSATAGRNPKAEHMSRHIPAKSRTALYTSCVSYSSVYIQHGSQHRKEGSKRIVL